MTDRSKKLPIWLLGVFLLLPTVRTAVAVYLEYCPILTYPLLQVVMLAVPIVVWRRSGVSRRGIGELAGLKRPNVAAGLVSGALMAGGMLAGYYILFRDAIDPHLVLGKIRSLGLLQWYWVMAVAMSFWNSLYEEYYWRAFLAGELGRWTSSTPAICLLAGGLFGLHHLFALMGLFGPSLVALFTLCTAGAGIVWTWMRLRGLSIWDCYISHVIADLAIFWIGYDLISRAS